MVLHTGRSSIPLYSGQDGEIVVGSQRVRKVYLTPEISWARDRREKPVRSDFNEVDTGYG